MRYEKVGLALGEGGARGLVHIGVLQVLNEEGIKISMISGTSIGAIVGAMYAQHLNPFEVYKRFRQVIESDIYKESGIPSLLRVENREARFWDQISSRIKGTIALTLAGSRISILDTTKLQGVIEALIDAKDFSMLKIPLMSIATDLKKGREVVLCVGDLKRAVQASASIPGFFAPVRYKDYLLGDGAISCPVPVKYCASSRDILRIGVAAPPLLRSVESLDNALEVMIRAEEINMHYFTHEMIKEADIAIVVNTGEIEWNEFHRIDELIDMGREAAKDKMPEIKELLGRRRNWKFLFKSMFSP